MKRQLAPLTLLLVIFSSAASDVSDADHTEPPVRHSIRMMLGDEISNTLSSDAPSEQVSNSLPDRKPSATSQSMIRVHELTGEISAIHAQLMQDEWFEDHRFDRTTPVLWDLRKAELPDDAEYLSRIVEELIQKSMQNRPEGRAGIIVSNRADLQLLCHAYQKSIQSQRMMITQVMSEVRNWLLNQNSAHVNHCK